MLSVATDMVSGAGAWNGKAGRATLPRTTPSTLDSGILATIAGFVTIHPAIARTPAPAAAPATVIAAATSSTTRWRRSRGDREELRGDNDDVGVTRLDTRFRE
ncbi:MAG TPA: hypothetical protein VMR29_09650 [Candidatus Binatia bacterium]|nr:hypothetical protein [Candidatus Binatia bacterium]